MQGKRAGGGSSCLGGSAAAAAAVTATTATTSTYQIDCQIARNSYVRVSVCVCSILAILSPEHGKPFRQQHTTNGSGWLLLLLGGGLAAASYRLLSIGRVACQTRNESKRDTCMQECGCVWVCGIRDHTDINLSTHIYIHTLCSHFNKLSQHTRTKTVETTRMKK